MFDLDPEDTAEQGLPDGYADDVVDPLAPQAQQLLKEWRTFAEESPEVFRRLCRDVNAGISARKRQELPA